MKILVIPDVHGRKFWRKAVSDNVDKVDKVIFLGDYLDPYPQEIRDNPGSMECDSFDGAKSLLSMLEDIVSLKKSDPNKYILLLGNHSDSYVQSKFAAASRTDYKNWEKYHKFFSQNLDLFNFVWVENDVIFSHAGINEEWAKIFCIKNKIEFKSILDVAKVLQNTPAKKLQAGYILIQLLGQISHYRGGNYNSGSCEWADIYEHLNIKESTNDNIIGIGPKDVFQVFGHTQLQVPLISDRWACLDCRQGFIIDTITHDCVSCL